MRAGPLGFALGPQRETSDRHRYDRIDAFLFEGRSRVDVTVDSDRLDSGVWVAPSIPLAKLAEHVRLCDGRRALDAGAEVTARCQALQRTASSPPDVWKSVPIEVTVKIAGFPATKFDWRADAPPRELLVLWPTWRAPR